MDNTAIYLITTLVLLLVFVVVKWVLDTRKHNEQKRKLMVALNEFVVLCDWGVIGALKNGNEYQGMDEGEVTGSGTLYGVVEDAKTAMKETQS